MSKKAKRLTNFKKLNTKQVVHKKPNKPVTFLRNRRLFWHGVRWASDQNSLSLGSARWGAENE